MILFKMMLLFEDANDLGAYLIQMKVIKGDHLINDIRKRVLFGMYGMASISLQLIFQSQELIVKIQKQNGNC